MSERGQTAVELLAFAVAMGGEAEEGEGEGSDAAGDESENAGEWARHRLDDEPALARDAHQPEAGIADHRHSGIADQRYCRSRFDLVRERPAARVFGMVIEALRRLVDAEVREQLARVTRILAENEVGG